MPAHMTPDQFRLAGRRLIDWIADYWESLEEYPVLSRVDPGWLIEALPTTPPESGEVFETMLGDVEDLIVPGLTHWQAPGFFAYFPANASGPAVLGELLSAGLGVQGMMWATSPSATELEVVMLDWLAEMTGLPDRFRSTSSGGGVIQGSASEATLTALVAARERATHHAAGRHGAGGDLTVYTSEHGHSSIDKAVRIAGYGIDQLRKVAVDDTQAMIPDALVAAIADDLAAGLTPAAVVATIGTTSTTAIDPVADIGEIARANGAWLHVDGAYAGTAAVCPEFGWITDGLDRADSYCFNPHKWMLTNFDCTAFYVADRDHLIRTLSVAPEYLRNRASASGQVVDYRDWQIPLGRRFRALKLWFVIRHYGVEGIRAHVRHHVELADRVAAWVHDHPDFEVVAPHPFGLVCFRHTGGNRVNQQIMDTVNTEGDAFLTHTKLGDDIVLRLAIGSPQTRLEHLESVWKSVVDAAAAT